MTGYFGGVGGGATQFQDTLVRPAGELGQNWMQGTIGQTPIVNPAYLGPFSISTAPDVINAMQMSALGSGVVASIMESIAIPAPTNNSKVWGKTQFCQATLVGDTGTVGSAAFFIGVMIRPGSLKNGYYFASNRGLPNAALVRYAPNAGNQAGSSVNTATLQNPIGANPPAIGTVIRISADLSVPGQVTLRVTLNGVLQATFVDNIAPLSGGVPGISAQMGAGTYWVRNFSCGLGL